MTMYDCSNTRVNDIAQTEQTNKLNKKQTKQPFEY